jgi:hypothetical protein
MNRQIHVSVAEEGSEGNHGEKLKAEIWKVENGKLSRGEWWEPSQIKAMSQLDR